MKHIITQVLLCMISAACFAQGGQMSDSLRQVRLQQMQQLIQERKSPGAVRQSPVEQTGSPSQERVLSPQEGERVRGDAFAQPSVNESLHDNIRLEGVRSRLDQLAAAQAGYSKEVEGVSVSALPLSELLRNIAKVYNVNISVKGAEHVKVTCNFSRVKITDLIYFLCKEYDLDIDVIGNIVSVFPLPPPVPQPKVIGVFAGTSAGTVSYDLSNDRLVDVMRQMTAITRVNFIIPQHLYHKAISGHAQDMETDQAIIAITSANGLVAQKNGNGIWEIADAASTDGSSYRRQSAFNKDELFVDSLGYITARIARGNVQEIITDLCTMQGLNYFFITPVNHTIPLNVSGVKFETLLGVMFSGTEYGYYLEEGIYLFGTFNRETLNSVRVIPLAYRSVSEVESVIPAQLKEGVELKTFAEMNSIIASGDQKKVQRVENFLRSIDTHVPLVTIEVIIADVTKSDLFEAGIGLGIGKEPVKTTGTLSPGIDMTLGGSSVNSLMDKGFGSVNLGKVTSQFYMTLKFMEQNGTIQMHSTPKLSTLNGNPAKLTSGEKSYYKEVQTNFWGSQTPTPSESYVWKEVEANLEIDITPYVSQDKLITLKVKIVQSEFTERVEENGPPGIRSRSFESIIRVQNEEMVLLGGIERISKIKGSTGLPLIARIPVLKWFFGKTKNDKTDQKLNVFIKPTVID